MPHEFRRVALALAVVLVAGCGAAQTGIVPRQQAGVAAVPLELIAVGRGDEKALRDKQNADVWIYTPSGSFERNLTQGHPATDDDPAFSNNGNRILFSSNRRSNDPADGLGPSAIWVMPTDGSAPPARLPIDLDGAKLRPAMSPNGTWVVFEVQHKDPTTGKGVEDIGWYNVSTRRAGYLTHSDGVWRYRDPTFCGSDRVAYTGGQGRAERNGLDIWIAAFIAGDPPRLLNPRNLTFESKDLPDHDPACDATGTRVAFHTHRYQDNCAQYLNLPAGVGARGEIAWLAIANPGVVHRVTNGLCNDARPAWSPDGTRIAFSDRPLEQNADGTYKQGNWYLAIAHDLDLAPGEAESVTRVQTASGRVNQSRRKDWTVRSP